MRRRIRHVLPAIAAGLVMVAANAQEPPPGQALPDKSQYNLFHPTPRQYLRDMAPDRPDQTESPYTVDAGHLQVELDFGYAEFARGIDGGREDTTTWGIVPVNVRLGLLNNVEVLMLADPYVHSRTEHLAGGIVEQASGFGDLQTRLKINFWGNEGGRTAFGVMPFIKWPLSRSGLRNGKTEGGIIVPFALDLGRGWSLGVMTEFDLVSDDDGDTRAQFVNSVTVGHSLTRKLGAYAEFYALARRSRGFRWQGQVDGGLTYARGAEPATRCRLQLRRHPIRPGLPPVHRNLIPPLTGGAAIAPRWID